MSDRKPRTAAGRALLVNKWLVNPWGEANDAMLNAILAIEQEAAALDVERLRAALEDVERQHAIVLLGTDGRVDAKGNPVRTDYADVPGEVASAIAAAYRGAD